MESDAPQEKEIITFPDWFEPEAIEYISDQIRDGNCEDIHRHIIQDWPFKVIASTDLERVWLRAKRYIPGRPYQGQIDLFTSIRVSFPPIGNYVSEREAELWRAKFLKKVSELYEIAGNVPRNFDTYGAMREQLFKLARYDINTQIDELSEDELKAYASVEKVIRKAENLQRLLSLIGVSISEMPYSNKGHGAHVNGRNAERNYFVRKLSRRMKYRTGEWKRTTVAEITSVLFECNYSSKEVVRCTKDLHPPNPQARTLDN